jgi:hypothetical protein
MPKTGKMPIDVPDDFTSVSISSNATAICISRFGETQTISPLLDRDWDVVLILVLFLVYPTNVVAGHIILLALQAGNMFTNTGEWLFPTFHVSRRRPGAFRNSRRDIEYKAEDVDRDTCASVLNVERMKELISREW